MLCLGLLGLLVSIVPLMIVFGVVPQDRWPERALVALVAAVSLWLLHRDHVRAAATLTLWGLWTSMIVVAFLNGGIKAPIMYMALVLASFSAVALGLRHTVAVCAVTALASIGLLFYASSSVTVSDGAFAFRLTIFVVISAILCLSAANLMRRFVVEAAQETARRLESQNYLDSIVQSVDGIVWEADAAKMSFTFVSQAATNLLGYPTQDWLGDTTFWEDHIHPDDRDDAVRLCLESTAAKKDHTFEYRMLAADGHVVWLRDIVTVVLREEEPYRLRGVMVDITSSKEAEDIQTENQQWLSLVVQAARIGWWYWDLSTGHVQHSSESLNLLGYAEGEISTEIVARNLVDLIHPDDFDRVFEIMRCFLDAPPDGDSFEYRMRHKDGTYRWIHTRARQLRDKNDRPSRILGVQQDITDRKLAEQTVLRSQRFESLGKLSGGVAHDLNNSLAPILMAIELLRMQYPEASDVVDTLELSAKRGTDIVRQLLTYAKCSEGYYAPVQLSDLVDELNTLMKGSFPKNIELAVNCEDELPTIFGDETQVHQILLNLAVNARDAMPAGGRLTVTATGFEVSAMLAALEVDVKPGNYVKLQVCDTGGGIAPDVVERIFDPFFTTKDPENGTGLGLSTVLGIVRGHGGFLEVDTLVDEGSTFTVYLPVSTVAADHPPTVDSAAGFDGEKETILFVDDEIFIRRVALAVLQRLNVTPLVAIDGADGLIQVLGHKAQLRAVITDLHMPRMGGLEFVRALRRILPDIPITVSSGGQMDDETVLAFRSLGVKYFLNKPFTEVQISEVLDAMLSAAPPRARQDSV